MYSERVTAGGRRVLEADPGKMGFLEGGEVVRMIGLGELLATKLDSSVGDSTLEATGDQRNCLFGRLTVLDTIEVVQYLMFDLVSEVGLKMRAETRA